MATNGSTLPVEHQGGRIGQVEPETAAGFEKNIGWRLLALNMTAVDKRVEGRGGQADFVQVAVESVVARADEGPVFLVRDRIPLLVLARRTSGSPPRP